MPTVPGFVDTIQRYIKIQETFQDLNREQTQLKKDVMEFVDGICGGLELNSRKEIIIDHHVVDIRKGSNGDIFISYRNLLKLDGTLTSRAT